MAVSDVDELAASESSVTPDEPPRRTRTTLAVVIVAAVLVDQLTKHWALNSLTPGVARGVGPGLHLNLTFNSGSAFSLGSGGGATVGLIAIAVTVGVLYLGRHQRAVLPQIVQGLVIGGALGNLIDRIFRAPGGFLGGHVVDFLQLPHWPIFNVADMCITTGAIGVAILSSTGRFGWTDA